MHRVLYLSRADVERVAPDMATIIGLLRIAFEEKGHGRVEMPPKPGIHTRPDAFIHAMPAYVPALGAAGLKWVSGYPENPSRGLPYISGLIVLNDPQTGLPLALMDCTWITAQRTGAATALAAQHLARRDSANAGVLACGVQGRANLLALACVFQVRTVRAYDIVPAALDEYVRDMSAALGIDVIGVRNARDAVDGMDLVVTSGPIRRQATPVIEAGWLAPGAFASAVDFDSYWTRAALRELDVIVTDDRPQFEYYERAGYFQNMPPPHASLEDVVVGRHPGRTDAKQRTMAMNLGIAVEDVVVAREVHGRAVAEGEGTWLRL